MNEKIGKFYGVGVGPGPQGFITVAAVEALKTCDVIFYPKATSIETSAALHCMEGIDLPHAELREVPFHMEKDRKMLGGYYTKVAEDIAEVLKTPYNVAFLTLGDAFTYSTYGYVIAALRDVVPGLNYRSFPGITSYAAMASALNFPLGEGKERVLILPCPDEMEHLRQDIETHDIVVLMKIGKRLPKVLEVIQEMDIAENCVFSRRIGFENEILCQDLSQLEPEESLGYLSSMLIRKTPKEKRHQ